MITAYLAALAVGACAQQQAASKPRFYSPTLAVLENEANKDVSTGDLESLKKNSGTTFTGEGTQEPAPPADPSGKHYVMEGTAPIPGINIYKPKEDPDGNGSTEKPEPKPLIDPKLTYGALGLGAAVTVAGLFFPPLLFLGGALMGAGAVLWFIGKKTKPKK